YYFVHPANNRLCMVLEYADLGSLRHNLDKSQTGEKRIDWGTKRIIATEIASGLAYLHSAEFVHEAITSSNIVLKRGYQAKICDFERSRDSRATSAAVNIYKDVRWTAPERLEADLNKRPRFRPPCDIYSYGVVLWEIVTEMKPWESLTDHQVF